jgi:hypothetical protein
VFLVDCGHSIEVSRLDNHIRAARASAPTVVQLPDCPECSTPIRMHSRYANINKQELADKEKIKAKQLRDDPTRAAAAISALVDEVRVFWGTAEFVQVIGDEIERLGPTPATPVVAAFRNAWSIYMQLCDFRTSFETHAGVQQQTEHLSEEVDAIMELIYKGKRVRVPRSQQRMTDVTAEIERLKALFGFYKIRNAVSSAKKAADLHLEELENWLATAAAHRFEGKLKERVQSRIAELIGILNISLLLEDELQAASYTDLGLGSWLRCSAAGHVYSASGESRCLECARAVSWLHAAKQQPLTKKSVTTAACPAPRHLPQPTKQANKSEWPSLQPAANLRSPVPTTSTAAWQLTGPPKTILRRENPTPQAKTDKESLKLGDYYRKPKH